MSQFKMKDAGCIVEIETLHIRSFAICRHFIVSKGTPDVQIQLTQDDINRARDEYKEAYGDCCKWDGDLEVLALHCKVAERFVMHDIILMHGSAIAVGNSTYLFTAPSGTGKTTHTLKWLENCPEAFVVNGDKPFIKINDDGSVLACGSPWAGKENLYTNTMVPLKSIILMERAEENHIEQISFAQAFPTLLQQVYRPEDEEKMRKTLKLMQRLNPAVSFWRFRFNNFKDDCFDVAYNALVRNQP